MFRHSRCENHPGLVWALHRHAFEKARQADPACVRIEQARARLAETDRKGAEGIFRDILKADAAAGVNWHYEAMPEEKHATIYHPAALKAFRMMFAPAAK